MQRNKPEHPVYYSERHQLRRSSLPDLQSVTWPSTLSATTTTEITDEDIGMVPDPIAQRRAEDFIRAGHAFQQLQAERATEFRRTFTPIAVRIAVIADEDVEAEMPLDVVAIQESTRC